MKELVVISGKGGTGKTSLTAALASLAHNMVLCDADVDAADLHLIADPTIIDQHDFHSGNTAVINPDKCNQCGLCRDLCRFDAVSDVFTVDAVACEGCGVCVYCCPEKAIDFPVDICGKWFRSDTRFGPMVHARLGIAAENSGKLVTLVRREARELAEKKHLGLILVDGPPGVGCPVIASIGGADAVLMVSEPSLSALHDLERVVQLAAHFKVPAMICINKSDLNNNIAREIELFAKNTNAAFLGRIPFDPAITKAIVQGQSVFELDAQSKAAQAVKAVWHKCLGL